MPISATGRSAAPSSATYSPRLGWRDLLRSGALFFVSSLCMMALGQAVPRSPVNLGTAGNYVILSKTGITDVPPSPITGNIGASPITGAAIGVTCAEVNGTISAVDAAGPAPCSLIAPVALGQAVLDMQAAYTDAAGRTLPDFTELGAGNISGMTLTPGLYRWSTDVLIDNTGVTLAGGPNAVWIFQIAGNVVLANSGHVSLAGGARASNVFWQVGGGTGVTVGTSAVFSGNILSATQVILNTGATLTGRALALTQVTLESTTVNSPGILVGGVPVIIPPTVLSTVPANLATAVPISSQLSATFSEAMDPTTITSSTFTLQSGAGPVAGTVNYTGVTATFAPAAPLTPNTPYTATITTGAHDPAGVALAANYVWNFVTGSTADVTPPTVISTVPANLATAVSLGSQVTATFSEALNPATITPLTFKLQSGSVPVLGTVSYAGVTATFVPLVNLSPNTLYTATITTGVTDLAGNALVSNYVYSFTTGSGVNATAPTVRSTAPASGAANVPASTAITATFSEAMNPSSLNAATFTVMQGSTPISGTVTYSGVTATFTPLVPLAINALYTATITTAATDLAGNPLANNYVWSFTTAAGGFTLHPSVSSTIPANGATAVVTTVDPIANFSEVMNAASINTSTFLLQQGSTPVPGTVTAIGASATFKPTNSLAPNTLYTATITTGVTDVQGNTLLTNYVWSFTTGAAAGQTSICLANFAVLSGAAINSSGASVITGDIGVGPGAAITGFPPGTLTGTVHTGDASSVQAMADFSAAYGEAVLRSAGAVPVSGDLSGQTLNAGLYNSPSSLSVSSGALTLDAKGDINAVFIFQVGSTLTTGSASQIILAGGARAFNVFWQVGGSATLGANSIFKGSILANQSITLQSGAAVEGRLSAQNGAITLQSNIVTSPPPNLAVGGILNAASYGQAVSPGSIASIFGNNLGSSLVLATSSPLFTTLGGSSFQVATLGSPLLMTSCNQANVQIPWETVIQTQAPVTATVGGLVSTEQPVTVAQFAPGIFTLNQEGLGQGAVEIAPSTQMAAPTGAIGRPVKAGEYISIFCTGLGPVSNQPASGAAALSNPLSITSTLPTVTIGDVAAQVTYSGLAPGFTGLYQVNALVPDNAPSGDSVNLILTIGGVQSNTVTIAIQ